MLKQVTIKGVRYGSDSSCPLDVYVNGEKLDPAPSQEIMNHDSEFNAGYYGSGPAQLALAILFHCTGNRKTSLQYHQQFKEEFLGFADYQSHNFEFRVDISDWVRKKHKEYFYPINVRIIEQSGLRYGLSNDGSVIMFREKGKPMVDFYPSSGRWRIVGTATIQKMQPAPKESRGAKAFLNWYERQVSYGK